tara:strand:+ start:1079 stop:1495 length:417 start_codon:yes stop_codon:yes gene_type:complete
MISSLDYLDIDVSDMLSGYIGPRVKYGYVIKELEKLIDVNICANYLRTFDSINSNYNSLELAHDLYTNHKDSGWLSNFPTKQPTWTPLVRRKGERIVYVGNDDYRIVGLGWRLKKFPPDKNKYQVYNLSLLPAKLRTT